jgi:hypothetical protein
MFGFLKKKPKVAASDQRLLVAGFDDDQSRPTRRKIEYLRRMFEAMGIGRRIVYLPEYTESKLRLETVVIGYKINDEFVFLARDLEFIEEGPNIRIAVHTRSGREHISRIEQIAILVPGDSTATDRQLDANARATLGGRGSLGRNTGLTLISTGVKEGNLKVEVQVQRHILLDEGVHKGMHVAVLDVLLGTLDDHEPRKKIRVPCSLPAIVTREGRVETWPCTILDYSETAIRAVLVDPNGRWPRFDRGRLANLRFQPNPEKPAVSLRCSCIKSRGTEAVFRMDYIVRGEVVLPFEIVDAMEIKIDLINAGGAAF